MTSKPSPRKRAYRSEVRKAGADETRRAILTAARKALVAKGYGALRMDRVAKDAGVALDTVYAAVGTKPKLVRLLIETAISGADVALPPEERDYVQRIRAEPSAAGKLAVYARALALIHVRLAPLVHALQAAASEHPRLGALWREISERRHRNMNLLASELVATGELRSELDPDEVADALWALGAPETFMLLTRDRGWSAERFGAWLEKSWKRLLLAD